MRNLNALLVFTKVAETCNFTIAAQRLGLTASAVSKSIARLEEELGVKLLNRSTRLVSLTDEGATFFERCRSILAEVDDAESAIMRSNATPKGVLNVQMPVALGRRLIAPKLLSFTRQYPELVLNVEMSDRLVDLQYEGIDAVVHVGPVADTRVNVKKLCNLRFAAFASPQYLKKHGTPTTPGDLDKHQCMAYLIPRSGQHRPWLFSKNGQIFEQSVVGALNINNAESLLEAAIAGGGITMISHFIAAEAWKSGQLTRILGDYVVEGPEVSVLYQARHNTPAKIKAFIDFLTGVVQDIESQQSQHLS
ncbi:LysR family transcriptional regulator [Orrella sp. NBD-18]|uniref:LysR family transcriptional regulator n=1 Tax=Sheuella amnicola TaxID=2707330 RepID=A0A6B2QY38_9BURK|nr:LysR family transcriptional regulator [Sheuella amnicola]NDY82588.1 LysR family transcriptional regulator [Sheuella amnicola]HBI82679.1 LysR family transcriptional regulator [Alcaligenaceae bacterium]